MHATCCLLSISWRTRFHEPSSVHGVSSVPLLAPFSSAQARLPARPACFTPLLVPLPVLLLTQLPYPKLPAASHRWPPLFDRTAQLVFPASLRLLGPGQPPVFLPAPACTVFRCLCPLPLSPMYPNSSPDVPFIAPTAPRRTSPARSPAPLPFPHSPLIRLLRAAAEALPTAALCPTPAERTCK